MLRCLDCWTCQQLSILSTTAFCFIEWNHHLESQVKHCRGCNHSWRAGLSKHHTMPQGSVLKPLLFILYTADIPFIAGKHGLMVHCYADDGQLYVFDKAVHAQQLISRVGTCIEEINEWMSSNRLKLNTDKTQFIWLGSRQQLIKVGVDSIHLGADVVHFQKSVVNLGVTIDSQLTMKAQIQRVCRTSFYQLRQLRTVRRSLSTEACIVVYGSRFCCQQVRLLQQSAGWNR